MRRHARQKKLAGEQVRKWAAEKLKRRDVTHFPAFSLSHYRFALWCSVHITCCFSLFAAPVKIDLPAETDAFKPAPGVELANGQCLSCHSVEYVVTQPP